MERIDQTSFLPLNFIVLTERQACLVGLDCDENFSMFEAVVVDIYVHSRFYVQ